MADAFSIRILREPEKCFCGSGRERFPLADARGIFVKYICDECEDEVKSHYLPEIFTDSRYEADDLGDDDDYFVERDDEY